MSAVQEWREYQSTLNPMTRLQASNLPKRFINQRLADYEPLTHTEVARVQLTEWAEGFGEVTDPAFIGRPFDENPASTAGIALIGSVGQTKTTLMCLAGVEIARRGYSVRYTTMADWLDRKTGLMGAAPRRTDDYVTDLDEARSLSMSFIWEVRDAAHLVILDDVGREHHGATGWAASELDTLLRHRYDSGLATALTSNLPLDAWSGEYSEGTRSLVQEVCSAGIIEMIGPDMRLTRAAR